MGGGLELHPLLRDHLITVPLNFMVLPLIFTHCGSTLILCCSRMIIHGLQAPLSQTWVIAMSTTHSPCTDQEVLINMELPFRTLSITSLLNTNSEKVAGFTRGEHKMFKIADNK